MSKRYDIDGKRWMKVSDAARLLKTNAVGIRTMMGDGRLDWRQTRVNSRTFVVDERAVLAMVKAMPLTPPKKPKFGMIGREWAMASAGNGGTPGQRIIFG